MISILGSTAIAAAAVSSLAGLIFRLRGRGRGAQRLIDRGHRAVIALFVAVTAAVVALEVALIGVDFSVRYVAANINRATPLLFRIIGLWGALEGSILLWAWVLAGYAALVAVRYRGRHQETVPLALAVLLGITSFFLLLMLGPANPFGRLSPAPPDGRGLNPLLANPPLRAVPPPFLYLGYVGFAVPYAFAVAALLSRTLRDEWMTVTRRWTVAAWSFLGVGIILGAWWSYEVLGWGGYWAWDPVENAAFMPWLVGPAFLHPANRAAGHGPAGPDGDRNTPPLGPRAARRPAPVCRPGAAQRSTRRGAERSGCARPHAGSARRDHLRGRSTAGRVSSRSPCHGTCRGTALSAGARRALLRQPAALRRLPGASGAGAGSRGCGGVLRVPYGERPYRESG